MSVLVRIPTEKYFERWKDVISKPANATWGKATWTNVPINTRVAVLVEFTSGGNSLAGVRKVRVDDPDQEDPLERDRLAETTKNSSTTFITETDENGEVEIYSNNIGGTRFMLMGNV